MKKHSPVQFSVYVLAVIAAISFLYGLGTGSMRVSIAVIAGNILSYVNIIAGYLLLKKFFYADKSLFFRAFFGGMIIRMLITLLLFVIIIGYTKINKISFTVSLVISYILYSVIEMVFINKNLEAKT